MSPTEEDGHCFPRLPSSPRSTGKAPVAQLDRAPDYEFGGQGFESSPVRHINQLWPISTDGIYRRVNTWSTPTIPNPTPSAALTACANRDSSGGMEAILVTVKTLAKLAGISIRQVWRDVKSGACPPPTRAKMKHALWSMRQVEPWLAMQRALTIKKRSSATQRVPELVRVRTGGAHDRVERARDMASCCAARSASTARQAPASQVVAHS